MQIEVIDTPEALAALREQWEEVYAADPEAHFFLSWTWMTNWLEVAANGWFVLAARPDGAGRYVAFLPLRLRSNGSKDGRSRRELTMAGSRYADYTGVLCLSEYVEVALPAFADAVKTLDWTELNFEKVRTSGDRFALFMDRLGGVHGQVEQVADVDPETGTDLNICPMIELPDDWDGYLATQLSANTRQKVRRLLRTVERSEALRITQPAPTTIDRDLDVLLRFWVARWQHRKGDRTAPIVATNRAMLRKCFDAGVLFLPILWDGERPVGALGSLIDRTKRSLLFVLGARDETCETPSPGLVLHAHSIRHAISAGLRTYDFLRGNEPYKYSYGVREVRVRHVVLRRRAVPCDVTALVKRATDHHRAGELVEAEQLYREVLAANPRHSGALYGLGQLLAGRGQHGAAEHVLRTFVSVSPGVANGWLRLAACLHARRKFGEAAEAYRAAIAREAGRFETHHGLAHALSRLGRREEAIAAFEAALRITPGHGEAEASLGNLLDGVGRLTPKTRRHYARVNLKLAEQRRSTGATDAAAALYRRALELDPNLAAARHRLGMMQPKRSAAPNCVSRLPMTAPLR